MYRNLERIQFTIMEQEKNLSKALLTQRKANQQKLMKIVY